LTGGTARSWKHRFAGITPCSDSRRRQYVVHAKPRSLKKSCDCNLTASSLEPIQPLLGRAQLGTALHNRNGLIKMFGMIIMETAFAPAGAHQPERVGPEDCAGPSRIERSARLLNVDAITRTRANIALAAPRAESGLVSKEALR